MAEPAEQMQESTSEAKIARWRKSTGRLSWALVIFTAAWGSVELYTGHPERQVILNAAWCIVVAIHLWGGHIADVLAETRRRE